MKFIRVNARPLRDLARGYSYPMGAFGDESEAHAGLSGYSLADGVEYAVERLDERMGVSGRFTSRETAHGRRAHRHVAENTVMYVTLFEGRRVGTGPDGEDLFAPSAIVASWRTTEIAGQDDLVTKIEALEAVAKAA